MPGWGGWGGASIPVRKNKVVRHVPGLDPTARKDSNVKHAIINEKKLKIVSKNLKCVVCLLKNVNIVYNYVYNRFYNYVYICVYTCVYYRLKF